MNNIFNGNITIWQHDLNLSRSIGRPYTVKPGTTLNDILDIAKKIRKMHKKGVRFVFIDSKLRLTHKNFKGGTLAQMLSEIFSILGTLTMQLEMAIMLVVQMPKENYANGK
jgi:hypothetical protein